MIGQPLEDGETGRASMKRAGAVGVLDDSPIDLGIIRRNIRTMDPDCDILSFDQGEEALSYLRSPERVPLDLFLVDIHMPRMTGFEFVDAYAGLHPDHRGDTRIVVMSHSIDPRRSCWPSPRSLFLDRERAETNPAVHAFFPKPVSTDELRDMFSVIR